MSNPKKEFLRTELNKFQNDTKYRFEFEYYDKNENPFEWKVLLEGTQGSIYGGGYAQNKIY